MTQAWIAFVIVAVPAIALLALAGWIIGSPSLVSLVPGLVAMNPLSAIGFLIASAGLWCTWRPASARTRLLGMLCGALVLALGAQRLVAYAVGVDFGLDRLLFRDALAAASGGRNHIAPNSAASFACCGLALLCLAEGRRRTAHLASVLAIATAVSGVLTLVGYAYHNEALVRLPRFIPMALNTALAFTLLGSGMLVVRTHDGFGALLASSGAGGAWARRLLPSAIFVPLVVGWLHVQGQRAGLYSHEFGTALMPVSTVVLLVAMTWWSARSLERADRVRARVERALRASEERLRAILDNALSIVSVKDLSGRLRFVNRRFEQIFHVSREAVEGKTDHELFPTDAADTYRAHDLRVLAGGASIELEEEFVLDDGPHVYEAIKFPLRNANGAIVAVCAMATDITARKRVEGETLRLQACIALTNRLLELMATLRDPEVYAAILDVLRAAFGSPVGIFGYLDEEGALVCAATTGEGSGPCGVESFVVPSLPHARAPGLRRRSWHGVLASALDDGRAIAVNTPHALVETGSELSRSLIAPIRYQGTTIGVLHLANRARDYGESDSDLLATFAAALAPALNARLAVQREEIERGRADAEVRRVNAELAASNNELEAFTYSVSHDLRAPLRAIDGFSRMLIEDHGEAFDGDAQRLIGVVCDNARHMGRLIDDLLALSHVGRRGLERTAVDMTELARAVARDLRVLEGDRHIDIRIADLAVATGDAVLLRQVYANLIGNALKFTRGKPHATIEIGSAAGDQGETVYFVRDDGAGFDMQYVDKVFDVFHRLHRAEDFEGTGVGLAIVDRIVRRHGGRVWAEGKINDGATFFFALPGGEGGHDARES